ncbi:MAG: hypothetical protein IKJ43_03170 [Bacilli bacterium]|nr:hypothetical protein [Bacilli bacterium]
MDKVGIPRGLFYYYYGDLWKCFFDKLGVSYIVSPNTNKEIMDRGIKVSNDEMCLSFKVFLGHVDYLKDKCDYILVPRISNFGISNQTCTNFLGAYDIVNNLFDVNVLNYNIDLDKRETLKKGLFKIGRELGKSFLDIKFAYLYAMDKYKEKVKKDIEINMERLNSKNTKILIVSHPYNTYDNLIGMDIVKYLNSQNVDIIYCDKFDDSITSKLSKKISHDLYFKYSKNNLGAAIYSLDKIDGILFISSFPCGPDSLANELLMRKIKKPYVNLIIDGDMSFTGIETRLESFLDVIRRNACV